MQDEVRQAVGSIAIAWNRAEAAIAEMAALYLDVDALTFNLLIKPLRAQDRERLLKAVIAAKEYDEFIKNEIALALKRTQICRENRSKIVHGLGDLNGHLTEASVRVLERVLREIEAECVFLSELHQRVTRILFDRNAREVPNDEDEFGDDELRPVAAFVPPERPQKPKQLNFDGLEIAG
ncbi:hypothetical protein [uncultured Tateyamaria sp.]|uniref:hypothetical protein n=1 Tax=uncultured Tateyamaria sp. TaxID=455651 RepID=UPI00261087D3|nr:hypothetical protein [uncultured Tateyamaria sp.]